jgi:predicted ABC-type transport system involved in lysophospholipase L1 biosynthesis ATPase subunit
MLEEAGRRGTTVVIVTHDRALLPRLDRVVDLAALLSGGEAA